MVVEHNGFNELTLDEIELVSGGIISLIALGVALVALFGTGIATGWVVGGRLQEKQIQND